MNIWIRHELLRNEAIRMSTLMYCNLTYKDKKTISRNGFYYDSDNEIYVCFSCNYHVKCTTLAEDLKRKHLKELPDHDRCNFLSGFDVSIERSRGSIKGKTDIFNYPYFTRDVDDVEVRTAYNFADPPIEYHSNRNNRLKYLHYMHNPVFIPSNGLTNESFPVERFMLAMRMEENRLKTFRLQSYHYPVEDFDSNSIERLAHLGYFYCLSGKYIECAFCRIVLADIDIDSDIERIHDSAQFKYPWVKCDRSKNIPYIVIPKPLTTEKVYHLDKPIEIQCKICFSTTIDVVYKCGHICSCSTCSLKLNECIICRAPLTDKRLIYFS